MQNRDYGYLVFIKKKKKKKIIKIDQDIYDNKRQNVASKLNN